MNNLPPIAAQIKQNHPHIEIIEDKHCVEVIYYISSVVCSKIATSKRKHKVWRGDKTYPKWIDSACFTRQAAIDKIQPVFERAKEKFNKIKNLLNQLQDDEKFLIGYVVEGDTHGIDEEYLNISFDLDGFSFEFYYDKDN